MTRIDSHTVLIHSVLNFVDDGVSKMACSVSCDITFDASAVDIESHLAASIPRT